MFPKILFDSLSENNSFSFFLQNSKVRGNKANPFYRKLIKETGYSPKWNFNKYLISRDGTVVSTYGSKVKPDSQELVTKIEELL